MLVTDDMVAAVRAYLMADKEEARQRNAALDRSRDATTAYKAMIMATFVVAVERKFSERSSREEIIEYVANVRSRGPDMPTLLDPTASERMIAWVISDEDTKDIDARMEFNIWTYFATAIVNDEGIYDQALDDFLAEARDVANDMLS